MMPRDRVSDGDRAVARAAASAFGGQAEVQIFYDADESHAVWMLWCADRPEAGMTTYSTVTVHNAPNRMDDRDIRVELVGVANSSLTEFPNVLATSAFCVMKDAWLAAPGVVFPNAMAEYDLCGELPHVMWAPPFPWPELSSPSIEGAGTVAWLLAIPISEIEYQFLIRHGFDEFEKRLEEQGAQYFDLNRASVVEKRELNDDDGLNNAEDH